MIYITDNQQTIEMLRSNTSEYPAYFLRLLNGQSHEIFHSVGITNDSNSKGHYLFNVPDLDTISNGYYYYQLLVYNNEIESIVECGLLQKGYSSNKPIEYNSDNNTNKIYNS